MHIDTQRHDNGKTAENTADATVTDVTAHEPDGGLIGIAPFSGPLGDGEIGEVVARNVVAGAVVQPDDAVMHYDRGNVARMRRNLARFENDCGNGAIASSLMEARRRARMERGIDIGPASAFVLAVLAVIAVAFAVLSVPSDAMAAVLDTDSVQGKTYTELGVDPSKFPDINAPRGILVDSDGNVIWSRNAGEQTKIASTTKIMTAIIALENSDSSSVISVSQAAASVPGSTANLKNGDTLSRDDALRGLLVPSGNDAAIAIAESVGKLIDPNSSDPYVTFIAKMNEKAKELGCTDTVYGNPHGYDIGQYAGDYHSTAADLAKIAAYAMKNETFRAIVAGGDATITATDAGGQQRQIQLKATDPLIGSYDGAEGVKTGTTDLAGKCFVGAVKKNGREYISVVLGEPVNSGQLVFQDTTALWDWIGSSYRTYRFDVDGLDTAKVTIGSTDTQVPIVATTGDPARNGKTVRIGIANTSKEASALDFTGSGLKQSVEITQVSGAKSGDKVGKITVSKDGEELFSSDLVAVDDATKPGIFEGLSIGLERFLSSFSGDVSVPPTKVFSAI